MRSNYKLIIWYPSLPKDWEVGMEVGQGDRNAMIANFSPLSSKYSDVQLPYKEIVNNSKFWDEVSEFPKIISLQHINTLEIITDKADIEAWLEGHGIRFWQIYQVAVSETEVFTLEDKVSVYGNLNKWIIKSFEISDKEPIKVKVVDTYNWELRADIDSIKKYKEPLFVTEDGIDIYTGDVVHWVNSNNISYLYSTNFSKVHPELLLKEDTMFKIFSTKEAAEKYIDENKPIYSKKQVREALECAVHEYIKYVNSTSWERTFKQKLNL